MSIAAEWDEQRVQENKARHCWSHMLANPPPNSQSPILRSAARSQPRQIARNAPPVPQIMCGTHLPTLCVRPPWKLLGGRLRLRASRVHLTLAAQEPRFAPLTHQLPSLPQPARNRTLGPNVKLKSKKVRKSKIEHRQKKEKRKLARPKRRRAPIGSRRCPEAKSRSLKPKKKK